MGQHELPEGFVELAVRAVGAAEAFRLGVDVGVEERLSRGHAPGPESCAADFVAIGLSRDSVRQAGHSAWMLWRAPARESAYGEIEASPPEMDRARLAPEARAEAG